MALVLKARGSFYVGGEAVEQSRVELGGRSNPDRVTVNQMYVEYMVPNGPTKVPVVMVHGATLSGKSFDTTPDGRIGWFEYFVRQAHPVYVVDQVGRARSGFNQALLNRAAEGQGQFPRPYRFGDRHGVWTNFRIGPAFGETFPGSQFPTEAIGELAKQSVPDMSEAVPVPNPTHAALSELSTTLGGAVLMSHSQSGVFPMEAALRGGKGIRGIVAVEPGTCRGTSFTDAQIDQLANVPALILYGDFLSVPTGYTDSTWQDRFNDCMNFVKRINAAGGKAEIMTTRDLGYRGNSHMLMHDRNHLELADFILGWMDRNARAELN